MKKLITILSTFALMIVLGLTTATSASALPGGRVLVYGSTSCYVSIDGNWHDGPSGTKRTLRPQGPKDSRTFWYDNDGWYISPRCNAKLVTGSNYQKTYRGGTWHKQYNGTTYTLKLYVR